jgi:hypothetical protein
MEAQELRNLIQESVRETMQQVLKEERLALCLALIPRVSSQEMSQIRAQLGNPSDYNPDDFVTLTDWIR